MQHTIRRESLARPVVQARLDPLTTAFGCTAGRFLADLDQRRGTDGGVALSTREGWNRRHGSIFAVDTLAAVAIVLDGTRCTVLAVVPVAAVLAVATVRTIRDSRRRSILVDNDPAAILTVIDRTQPPVLAVPADSSITNRRCRSVFADNYRKAVPIVFDDAPCAMLTIDHEHLEPIITDDEPRLTALLDRTMRVCLEVFALLISRRVAACH